MFDKNRDRTKRRRAILIAVIVTILCGLLAALASSLFVIAKLNRNNLFIKSILVDNNYILNPNGNYDNDGADAQIDPVIYAVDQLFRAVGELDDFKVPMKYLTFHEDGVVSVDMTARDQFAKDMMRWFYVVYDYYRDDGTVEVWGEPANGVAMEYESAEYVDIGDYEAPDGYSRKEYSETFDLENIVARLESFFDYARSTYTSYGVCPASDRLVEGAFKHDLLCRHELTFESTAKKKNALLGVPYISQEGILPNGCESVSATMLLRYFGFDIAPEEFVDDYLECEPVSIKWGCRYGPNPKLVYAGDPRSENAGYGCFAPVIVRALNKFLADEEYHAKNVSGMSLEQLKKEYIDRGIPVAVWATVGMKEIDKIILWQSTDGSESFMYPANEHCMVFCGYDSDGYIFADPYGSNGIVRYSIDESVLAYNSLNMQAVVVLPDGNIGER